MPEIIELPIAGKIKEKFLAFLDKNPLDKIYLGNFMKLEGGGNCGVCNHNLKWGFTDFPDDNRVIGICCGTNIIALQKCKGNFDKLNFERLVKLERKTIIKRQIEWEKTQKALQLEIKYNEEFKFCSEVVNLVLSDNFFKEHKIVSEDDDDRNREEKSFFYAGLPQYKCDALSKVFQCDSWLRWLKAGTVSDYYLENLHRLMPQTPLQIVNEAKERLIQFEEIAKQKEQERQLSYDYFEKVVKLKEIRLGKYDVDFVKSLNSFFSNKDYFTENQRNAIDRLCHKYRKQIER